MGNGIFLKNTSRYSFNLDGETLRTLLVYLTSIILKYAFFQQTCTQCPHICDPHHDLGRILRVPIPPNSGIMFDMKSAIMDTLIGRDESDIQCPGCGHQSVSNKMTLPSILYPIFSL